MGLAGHRARGKSKNGLPRCHPEPTRLYQLGNEYVVYCFQTLLPRFARDAVVLSWISLISAFPARRISWRQSKN